MTYTQYSSAADDREHVNFEEIFGNDNGEDELPEVLASYFIETSIFTKVFDKFKPIQIIVGKKGMGKSALLAYLQYQLSTQNNQYDNNPLIVKVTGNELIGLADFNSLDSAKLENLWKQVICKRIAMEIAKEIKFAYNDDLISLVESAEIERYKDQNMISVISQRFSKIIGSISKATTGSDLDVSNNKSKISDSSYELVLKRLQENEQKSRSVWLLVDDIDAKFIDNFENQQRVGAFFSALRFLAVNVNGIKCRASIRTDIWTNLRTMEDKGKFKQYVTQIVWKDNQLQDIFANRILSYMKKRNLKYSNFNISKDYFSISKYIFTGSYRKKKSDFFDPIQLAIELAGKRPRWIGQLCKLAGSKSNVNYIRQDDFNASMPEFGREKIDDLISEHVHQFSDLKKLINSFRSTQKRLNKHQLDNVIKNNYINKLNETSIPILNGNNLPETSDLAKFLYEIDFIVGEKGDSYSAYHQDPDLYDSPDNLLNKIQWMINLSYREYLSVGH